MKRLRDWLRQRDSLFVRMLLIQSVLAMGLSAIYFGLYFVERNRTVAALLADRWALPLAVAAGLPDSASSIMQQVQVRQHLPATAHAAPTNAPRMLTLKHELSAHGIAVQEIALDSAEPRNLVWLRVARPDAGPVWLGVSGPLLEHHEFRRIGFGLILATALVILLSWHPARRMTRRLERLRLRIRRGEVMPPEPPDLASTPEIVEIERAYDALLAQVQRQQSERTLLLAGVSHDLRSPLGRIRMAAELLPEDPALAPRRASIVRNVQAADRLIESFLDLVRSSEWPLNEVVDVADTARSVAAAFEHEAQSLQVDVPDVLELPNANQHLIERAVFNLLDNAFKYGAPPVKLSVRDEHDEVLIEVHDGGPGVPEPMREGLLRAFARGDASRGKSGSGLGLAVVQQVTSRLSGRVEFDGQPGQWAVRLRLPLVRPNAPR
jgi:two-component system osmolarity sensor histidine kinase EnvZ